jgi:hypothetical protein
VNSLTRRTQALASRNAQTINRLQDRVSGHPDEVQSKDEVTSPSGSAAPEISGKTQGLRERLHGPMGRLMERAELVKLHSAVGLATQAPRFAVPSRNPSFAKLAEMAQRGF